MMMLHISWFFVFCYLQFALQFFQFLNFWIREVIQCNLQKKYEISMLGSSANSNILQNFPKIFRPVTVQKCDEHTIQNKHYLFCRV